MAREPDRYEPLPGITELPRWLWRRTPKAARIAIVVVLVTAIPVGIVAADQIRAANEDRAEELREERARHRAQRIEELNAVQRPRTGRSAATDAPAAPAQRRRAARERIARDLRADILDDARDRVRRGRLSGPVERVECDRYPRTVDAPPPERDLAARTGSYSCVAVTAEFDRNTASVGGVIGHPFRALVDFRTGRYTFCKIVGAPGPARNPLVTVPRACGGR